MRLPQEPDDQLQEINRVTEPELPLFFDLIRGKGESKNKPTCENAVSQTLYGSCTLQDGLLTTSANQ